MKDPVTIAHPNVDHQAVVARVAFEGNYRARGWVLVDDSALVEAATATDAAPDEGAAKPGRATRSRRRKPVEGNNDQPEEG